MDKYLSRYAETEANLALDIVPAATYQHVLVIPCFSETTAFLKRLLNGPLGLTSALVIVVINQNHDHSEPLNETLLQYFAQFPLLWQQQHLSLRSSPIDSTSNLHWLVVNRCHNQLHLPKKQGVGLARKIGCDIALALIAQHHIISPWVHSSDADAHLPADYFDLPKDEHVAAVYQFAHIQACSSEAIWQATQRYETALRYYIAGLRWAGSPYTQQPIGSLLAFKAEAYCAARGFPKRSAGEDFYLLNKLCKLGPVYNPKAQVQLEARVSERVPFGTGPAVKAIAALEDPESQYLYYAPETFVALKQWLDRLPEVWPRLQQGTLPLADLPQPVQNALLDAGVEKLWPHLLQQARDNEAGTRMLHNWFDAFQTLKFIRRLQNQCYPERPLSLSLKLAPFTC